MTVKYGKFQMPTSITLDEKSASSSYGRFVAEPFERGFGHTLGNSIRRLLLNALEAPSIISVRFEGAPHEYMAIDGVVEDMTHIILNLKGALLRKLPSAKEEFSHDPRIVTTQLEVTKAQLEKSKGQFDVTLGDLIKEGTFEVVNPELHLFSVTKPISRQIDFRVGIGRGYVPTERIELRDRVTDEILIDASFSPVRLVKYYVENTRVGQDTDFDRLIFEITTDGRIKPSEALSFATQIALSHFEVFNQIQSPDLSFEDFQSDEVIDQDELMEKLALRIDEIELSVRSTNCLSGANIDTIAELVSIPERRMLEFRNFGKKSLNEIKAKLTDMGLGLGMDLTRFGITSENAKQKIKEFLITREQTAEVEEE